MTIITTFKPIDADRYNEMLNIMPTAIETSMGFMVGEAVSDRLCRVTGIVRVTFSAFVRFARRHYEAETSMTLPEFRALTPSQLMAGVPA